MAPRPFTTLTGLAAPLPLANVDTDVIIRVERMTSTNPAELAPWAFESLRYDADGDPAPGFVLNDEAYTGAPILVAGPNFGCGSSREPAVWAVMGLGFRCVIAPSFGDIFRANCLTNGVLPVALDGDAVAELTGAARRHRELTVDLPAQQVRASGRTWHFEIGAAHKLMLVDGVDEMTLSQRFADQVSAWETRDRQRRPWAWPHPAGTNPAREERR
jgi:3-isopropylmalate/(R)-2-methylmalate dehydratase small subunit